MRGTMIPGFAILEECNTEPDTETIEELHFASRNVAAAAIALQLGRNAPSATTTYPRCLGELRIVLRLPVIVGSAIAILLLLLFWIRWWQQYQLHRPQSTLRPHDSATGSPRDDILNNSLFKRDVYAESLGPSRFDAFCSRNNITNTLCCLDKTAQFPMCSSMDGYGLCCTPTGCYTDIFDDGVAAVCSQDTSTVCGVDSCCPSQTQCIPAVKYTSTRARCQFLNAYLPSTIFSNRPLSTAFTVSSSPTPNPTPMPSLSSVPASASLTAESSSSSISPAGPAASSSMTFAPASSNSVRSPTPSSTALSSHQTSSSKPIGPGAIAGIVVGAIVLLVFIAAAFRRIRRGYSITRNSPTVAISPPSCQDIKDEHDKAPCERCLNEGRTFPDCLTIHELEGSREAKELDSKPRRASRTRFELPDRASRLWKGRFELP